MPVNAAKAYNNTKIQTASQADLTLMLYEGAIKFCNKGLIAIEKKDIAEANTNIIKAEKIITELRVTLDHKYPVAKDFETIYAYIYQRLIDANIKKDKEILEDALNEIRGMRDTWKEVVKRSRQQGK